MGGCYRCIFSCRVPKGKNEGSNISGAFHPHRFGALANENTRIPESVGYENLILMVLGVLGNYFSKNSEYVIRMCVKN